MYDDEERERPSWREIDKKKDRSRFVREEKPQYQSKKSKSVIANYKHKLKEAFRTGKVAEAIDKLEGDTPEKRAKRENMKILAESDDIKKFSAALDWYISQNYEEMDVEILNKTLDFEKDEMSLKILTFLKSRRNIRDIISHRNIAEKLNLIQMTSRNIQLKFLAKEILSTIGD
ncbi:MAG: hypothetical protein N3B13_12375 [Deltaproteobacteria bacterium]|nr:hypothetical protein [Deltaproteobacteria bacterium]